MEIESKTSLVGEVIMDSKYLLGVDIGTTSIKVAVIDDDGKVLGICSSPYHIINSQSGYFEIDSDNLWKSFLKCLNSLFKEKVDPKKIIGIGISCLCPGLTAIGENGEILVEPIIYSDRRSIEEAEIIKKLVGEDLLFDLTANGVMAGAFSGTSMLWVKRNLPDIYSKIKYFGHLNTLMAYKMTGHFAIDYSNASYTCLFETTKGSKGGWSELLCEKIGIDIEKLPPLMSSTDIVGKLKNEDLISLGLPENIDVVIGGADTPCATLAAGVTNAGDVCESVGTTNVLTICVDEPIFDKSFINRCHVVDGTWIYQGAISHAGSSYQWFRDNFCQDVLKNSEINDEDSFLLMNREAEKSKAGSGGIVFLPYMSGERSPVWDPYAKGVFFGVSLQSKREDFNRAIMEGCGYGLRQLIEVAESITGITFNELSSIGGGAKSETWAQIKADITGKNINILDMNDMAPLGAALLAGVGTNIFKDVYEASKKIEKKIFKVIKSNSEHLDIYERGYKVYIKLYPQLKELYRIR